MTTQKERKDSDGMDYHLLVRSALTERVVPSPSSLSSFTPFVLYENHSMTYGGKRKMEDYLRMKFWTAKK